MQGNTITIPDCLKAQTESQRSEIAFPRSWGGRVKILILVAVTVLSEVLGLCGKHGHALANSYSSHKTLLKDCLVSAACPWPPRFLHMWSLGLPLPGPRCECNHLHTPLPCSLLGWDFRGQASTLVAQSPSVLQWAAPPQRQSGLLAILTNQHSPSGLGLVGRVGSRRQAHCGGFSGLERGACGLHPPGGDCPHFQSHHTPRDDNTEQGAPRERAVLRFPAVPAEHLVPARPEGSPLEGWDFQSYFSATSSPPQPWWGRG